MSISRALIASILALSMVTKTASAEEDYLLLEPMVQGFSLSDSDYAFVQPQKDKFYISLVQIASYVGAKLTESDGKYVVAFQDDKTEYIINLKDKYAQNPKEKFSLNDKDYREIDGEFFVSTELLQKLLDITININTLNMQLEINRQDDFPNIRKLRAAISRSGKGIYKIESDPISNYKMDNRFFSLPTLDLSVSKGWNDVDHFKTDDTYSASFAGILAGLDVNAYLSGNFNKSHSQTKRISAGRIFLDDNVLNLKTLKMGDISNISSSYFNNNDYGRGIMVSSFKNLVMSADKTIDITGPLPDGWEVELYWNDQLVGYRQSGEKGEYLFPKMPVSYGLNTFKLVFYGPYGEMRTETKRYYSGTSPVKKGEVGYNFAAFQAKRSVFSNDEDDEEASSKPTLDMTMYYGLTDETSVMGGISQTQDSEDKTKQQLFSMVGIQTNLQGASFQYNFEQNLDTNKIGHHVGVEGDIYIGSILAQYDYFGQMHSPLSYNGTQYMKDKLETRLSGTLPLDLLYYLQYERGRMEDDDKFYSYDVRLSKQLSSNFNLTAENTYYKQNGWSRNLWKLGLLTWKDKLTTESWLGYQTKPESKFQDFSFRVTWRSDRYTYYTARYTKNFAGHTDNISLSAGRSFDWGGLTASFDTNTKFDASSARLTYTIGFGPKISNDSLFYSGKSKLTETGTIYAELYDAQNNQPLEGVGVKGNGITELSYSDSEGHAFVTDLSTYEKTIFSIDLETLDNVSLRPQENDIKLVLRPGAVCYLKIPFIHYGSLEGQLPNPQNRMMLGYSVSILDKNGEVVASSYSDMDGYFIIDEIPFGEYSVIVKKNDNIIKRVKNVKIDDSVVYFETASLSE